MHTMTYFQLLTKGLYFVKLLFVIEQPEM